MKEVMLLGTSHSIQRGERSAKEFGLLLSSAHENSGFSAIAEEIDDRSTYLAEQFCTENKLEYRNVNPSPDEGRSMSIPTGNDIIRETTYEYDEHAR